jgi:Holliday junction resolvasome RuvABC ATP-dependent DNA helicase subunit
MGNRILFIIMEKFNGGLIGITIIATAITEEPETIEEV